MDIKFLSSNHIIGNTMRDFGLDDSGLIFDAKEWVVDALERIGTPYIYTTCTKVLTIENYTTDIPCPVELLGIVKYNDTCICWMNHNPCIVEKDAYVDTQRTVAVDNNKLRFNFKEGEVTLYYKSFKFDDEGFPMVIDNPQVRDAISAFIMMKLIYSGVNHPVFGAKDITEMWETNVRRASNSLNMPAANTADDTFKAFRDPNSIYVEL